MVTRMIRRIDPFTPDALSLRDMMDRVMENAYVSPSQWLANGWNHDAPAIDVIENNDGYVIKAALPGWKPEDVEVTFEDGVLTLKGEAKQETEDGDETAKVHRREIRHASFARRLSLPAEIDTDKAKAEFEHGVLVLNMPKAEVVKPKQIKIGVK